MTTKHERILDYIRNLNVGDKISVRTIAKEIGVSEGTAYRAIKEAESEGLVTTIERIGTVRIDKKKKENIEKLTFAEVVNIVDGQVLGGRDGLHKSLNKFLIGAMKLDDMLKYIEPDSLLIVGNRNEAHRLALQKGAAVLITGGFDAEEEIKEMADCYQLPIISSSYDTFTVASMINRAIYDNLIKKEIILVEDILIPFAETYVLHANDTVADWHRISQKSGHTRFPVIDQHAHVIGVATSKDVIGKDLNMPIERIITRAAITTGARTTVAAAAHLMVWEGIELLPVVDSSRKLIGVLSRRDVIKALQYMQKQPQIGETFENLIFSQFTMVKENGHSFFKGKVVPQMTNNYGTLSSGVLMTIMSEACRQVLREQRKGNYVIENTSIYFLKPVQIDKDLWVKPSIIEIGRKMGKVDVEVHSQGKLVAKALLAAQVWEEH